MLKEWVDVNSPESEFPFKIIEYLESNSIKESIPEIFSKLLQENTVDNEFLKDLAKKPNWNWEKVQSFFVIQSQPTNDNLKKGKFGEVCHGQILEEFYDYIIPIKKFQYQFTKGQSPTGTDMVAIKMGEGKISELCYVETRLRTSDDYAAVSGAFNEIIQGRKERINSVIKFILKELFKIKHELYDLLTEYGIETAPKDKFRIGAIFEKDIWRPKHLENLRDVMQGSTLDLTVDVIKINNLEKLVNDSYEKVSK